MAATSRPTGTLSAGTSSAGTLSAGTLSAGATSVRTLPAALTPLTLQLLFFGLLWGLVAILALRFVFSMVFNRGSGAPEAKEIASARSGARASARSSAPAGPNTRGLGPSVGAADKNAVGTADRPVRELLIASPAAAGEVPHLERIVLGSSEVSIGRSSESRLKLDDEFASLNHALLRRQDGGWLLEDLGSTNGTFVNERQVTRAVTLNHGDTIRIGKTTITLQ